MKFDLDKLKSNASKFFGSDLNDLSTQLQMLATISKVISSVSILSMPIEIQQSFQKDVTDLSQIQQLKESVASNIEKWIAISDFQKITDKISVADNDLLSAVWFAMDFYAMSLGENSASIRGVADTILNELANRGCLAEKTTEESITEGSSESVAFSEVPAPESASETPEIIETGDTAEIDCNSKAGFGENVQQESNKSESEEPKFNIELLDEQSNRIVKSECIKFINKNINTAEGQAELALMISDLFGNNDALLKKISSWKEMPLNIDKATFKRGIGETALCLEAIIKNSDADSVCEKISKLDRSELSKCWVALDYYAFSLKPEYSLNIRNLRDYLTGILIKKEENLPQETENCEPACEVSLFDLQQECHQLENEQGDPSKIFALKKEICNKLLSLDAIYVAYDEDYSNVFPYIGLTGKLEVFTKEEYAIRCRDYFKECEEGRFSVIKIENIDFNQFLTNIYNIGVEFFNLDNGVMNVEIPVCCMYNESKGFYIDDSNRGLRNCLIRRLQIVERYNNIISQEVKAQIQKTYVNVLNTLTSKGYSKLCNGIVYALMHGPYVENVTFYTEGACKKVQRKLSEAGVNGDLHLIAPGDNRYVIVDSVPRVGVINIRNKGIYACAFTDKNVAIKVREEFKQSGSDDNIVAMTFEEFLPHALKCEGVAIDMPEYAYMISKKELESINAQIQRQK